MKNAFLLVLMAVPSIGLAAPTYLACRTPGAPFKVTLDEQTSRATHTTPDGRTFQVPAAFAADEVRYTFSEQFGRFLLNTHIWISRINLEGRISGDINGDSSRLSEVEFKCELVETPKRAF